MTTLTVTIDKTTRRKYRMHEKAISFEELRRRIIGVEALASLKSTNRAAAKSGLPRLTSKDIEREIKAARNGSRRS